MKKYIMPQMEVVRVNNADIIATSVGFGEGNTDVMYSREGDFEFFE